MKRLLVWGAIPWVAGCAVFGASTAGGAGASACRPVRVPLEGIVGCLPGDPVEVAGSSQEGSVRGAYVEREVPGGKVRFSLVRLRIAGARNLIGHVPPPDGWLRIDTTRELSVDGFPARVTDGLIDADTHRVGEVVAVGSSLYVAEVHAPAKVPLDPALLSTFFGSVHVEVPFRIVAAPDDRYTVAVPEAALREPFEQPVSGGKGVRGAVYSLGGTDQETFAVLLGATAPGDKRSADEVLADAEKGMVRKADRTILGTRDVTLGALHGHEITARNAEGVHVRARIFVAGERIYTTVVGAQRLDALSGPDATRFLDSFQIVHTPAP